MIQRIQSLFIFLAAAFLGVMFFFPVFTLSIRGIDGNIPVYINGFKGADTLYSSAAGSIWFTIFMILTAVTVAVILVALFSYKNRPRQIKLCVTAFILDFIFIALLFFVPDRMTANLNPGLTAREAARLVHYGWCAILPVLSLAALHLATRYIKKDEDLVRSADRLR